ncbi:MAG: trigger factor [Dehalococcoidia bacterium]|nr:trigger factor [Dehalococcoidia bacterium]
MKVTLERLPESRVQLDIEVEADRFEKSKDAAYRRLAPRAKVPGFRPGKAPRQLTEKYIGTDRLLNEAIDKLLPEVYNEAIEEHDVDAIAQPELDKIDLDPLRLKFIVAVRPAVDLGAYKEIRIEPEPVEVTDEMLDEQVTLIQRRYATQVPADRPVAWNDILIADVKGTIDDETFVEDLDAEFPVREGTVLFVEGLAEAFIGMAKGEEKSVVLAMPEDFRVERLAGKTATFTLTIKEVKEEQLPELDDEFAQQVNPDEFQTFAALRERILADLTKALTEQADAAYRTKAVDALVEGATIEFPRVLVEREIDHIVRDSMGNDQQQYAQYLRRVGRSESEYRESLRDAAESRVRRSLALNELAEAEGIDVSAEEIEGELDKLVEPLGDDAERFRQMFATDDGVATLRRNLLGRKTLDRLAAIAQGEAQEETE